MIEIWLRIKRTLYRLIFGETRLKRTENYLLAYAGYMDKEVRKSPKKAVGGYWEELGRLQFDFLISQGLKPSDRLLDIGCGTLRSGRFFIGHLGVENYWGFDISKVAISHALELVVSEQLAFKRPTIFTSLDNLNDSRLNGEKFDLLWAQSVFTHLTAEYIVHYFEHCAKLMKEGGRFYFTYDDSTEPRVDRDVDFAYPFSFFQDLAKRNGLTLTDQSSFYKHPRNQRMLLVTL